LKQAERIYKLRGDEASEEEMKIYFQAKLAYEYVTNELGD
jgi:hypothetical protein